MLTLSSGPQPLTESLKFQIKNKQTNIRSSVHPSAAICRSAFQDIEFSIQQLACAVIQKHPFLSLKHSYAKKHFNIILKPTPISLRLDHPSGFTTEILLKFLIFSFTLTPRPSRPLWSDHNNSMWRRRCGRVLCTCLQHLPVCAAQTLGSQHFDSFQPNPSQTWSCSSPFQ